MERWIVYALISTVFAGCTSVVAKMGLTGITGELGIAVRSCFVFAFVLLFAAYAVPVGDWRLLTRQNLLWLALSAATTTVSWVFYYKAIHAGEVSTVALIDKGSFLVAVLLAWLLLGEKVTLRTFTGSSFILVGLVIVSRR